VNLEAIDELRGPLNKFDGVKRACGVIVRTKRRAKLYGY
jgi:hypothetical protein